MVRKTARSFWVVAFVAFLISHGLGLLGQTQASSASLSGVVTDPSGARVAGALVTVANPAIGITRAFTTDSSGGYSFSILPPGTYGLTVAAPGFQAYKQDSIELEVGQSANRNVILGVGNVSQQVEVSSQAPLLNTDNANVASQIDSKQIVELPLNLRNVFGLVTLNSSVNNGTQGQVLNGGGEQGTADQDISFFNFGGGFFGTTAFLLDGAWDTADGWGGVVYVPSVDGTQEFKVQNNSFTAQYGWSTGNVINVITKGGTSQLHGSAYEFFRNDALDANSWFSNHNEYRAPLYIGTSSGRP